MNAAATKLHEKPDGSSLCFLPDFDTADKPSKPPEKACVVMCTVLELILLSFYLDEDKKNKKIKNKIDESVNQKSLQPQLCSYNNALRCRFKKDCQVWQKQSQWDFKTKQKQSQVQPCFLQTALWSHTSKAHRQAKSFHWRKTVWQTSH